MIIGSNSFDPFDSYPPTSLPRSRVQNLIVHFLSKIAFQYYPLDLNPISNPFINSWWPLALADPALFNVSLQTASLDAELHAQKGFHQSEILMHDAVSLIRHKIDDPTLAFQDATMDAVVTLAAIEHGKGNSHECKMHIDAVKRMVAVRGGIAAVKESSPLTARMVPWVSMLVTGSPQFGVQDDFGNGDGIAPIDLWLPALKTEHKPDIPGLTDFHIDFSLRDIQIRLGVILNPTVSSGAYISTNDLHDLTCYVLHKLLLPFPTELTSISESFRYALATYMFIIHGPTYYSHAAILHNIVLQLRYHLQAAITSNKKDSSLLIWCLSVGMSASIGTDANDWFMTHATTLARSEGLETWESVESCLQSILAIDAQSKAIFHTAWQPMFNSSAPMEEPPGDPSTTLKVLLDHENSVHSMNGPVSPAESSPNAR